MIITFNGINGLLIESGTFFGAISGPIISVLFSFFIIKSIVFFVLFLDGIIVIIEKVSKYDCCYYYYTVAANSRSLKNGNY